MLAAERKALAADIVSKRQDVRNLALSNLVQFLDGLSTQAALFAGFAFTGLAETAHETPLFWKIILYTSTSMTLGSNMYVVCVGQLSTILGPNLALNGPTGSLERAVDALANERERIFRVFAFGVACFFVEIMAVIAITVEDTWLTVVCELVLLVSFGATATFMQRSLTTFSFKKHKLHQLVAMDKLGSTQGVAEQEDESVEEPSKQESSKGVSAADFLNLGAQDKDS